MPNNYRGNCKNGRIQLDTSEKMQKSGKNIERRDQWVPCVPGARVPGYKVAKLSEDVTPHLNQVFMAGRSL